MGSREKVEISHKKIAGVAGRLSLALVRTGVSAAVLSSSARELREAADELEGLIVSHQRSVVHEHQ